MVSNVAYVQLSGPSSIATLGLYAGIPPQELQQLVRVAIRHGEGACAGFLVASDEANSHVRRNRYHSNSIQRLVPLSVACKVPHLLQGRVSALIAPCRAKQRAFEPENTASNDLQRLHRLIKALESEMRLSSFESAMLYDQCEQQSGNILTLLEEHTSVDQKRDFLLRLLRPNSSEKRQTELHSGNKPTKKDHGQELQHGEVLAKQIEAIGRKIASPLVQMQVLALSGGKWAFTEVNQVQDTIELLSIVETLLDKHVVSEAQGAYLVQLALEQNLVLWSAFYSLKYNKSNLSDFEATATRVAALNIPLEPIVTNTSDWFPKESTWKQSSLSIVESLYEQHMVTRLEREILVALVAQNDSQVQQLIRDYLSSENKDIGTLRDVLVNIVEALTLEVGDEEKAAAEREEVDELHAYRNRDDNQDRLDNQDMLQWQRQLTSLLTQWHARHELTSRAAQTLQKMVTQRHHLLESAYEVFATDADATELLDTLQRVATVQHQMAPRRPRPPVRNRAAPSHGSLATVVHCMQQRGRIQSTDATGLLRLFDSGNEALRAANEVFEADDDVHELEETLMLVVKHARFNRAGETSDATRTDKGRQLLAECGRSKRLAVWQIQLLTSLLNAHDSRFLAAMDVYDEDNQLDEVVETLAMLASLAAKEDHDVYALVQDWITVFEQRNELTRTEAEHLMQLVNMRDARLAVVFALFRSDENQDEFATSLHHIAKVTLAEWTEGQAVLALVQALAEQGIVSCDERKQLETLVCRGETRMLAAMDVLAETRDAADFADTARHILAKLHEEHEANDVIVQVSMACRLGCAETSDGEARQLLRDSEDGMEGVKETADEVAACSVVAECGSLEDKAEEVDRIAAQGEDEEATEAGGDQAQDVEVEASVPAF